jgi:hypothetical protein
MPKSYRDPEKGDEWRCRRRIDVHQGGGVYMND